MSVAPRIRITILGALLLLAFPALAADVSFTLPPLDHGFQLLYNLDFDQAHSIFSAREQSHPDDPMGPTCDAAGLLFSEAWRSSSSSPRMACSLASVAGDK